MGKKYKKTKRYSKTKTKRYSKTKRYRKRKYNHKNKKNMKGGNMETIGRAALAGASAPLILGSTPMGAAGLAAVAGASNVVRQASENRLCGCYGRHFGEPCTGCKKPSRLTPFCRGEQNCCRGRFQKMFGQEPLINTNVYDDDEHLNHFVCKECLSSEKRIMLDMLIERERNPETEVPDEVVRKLSRDENIPGRPYYLDENERAYLRRRGASI